MSNVDFNDYINIFITNLANGSWLLDGSNNALEVTRPIVVNLMAGQWPGNANTYLGIDGCEAAS